MNTKKIKDVRWATKKEVDNFYQFLKKKNNEKDLFTSDWLSKNGNYFIELHQKFINDKTDSQIEKYKLSFQSLLLYYKNKLSDYENSLNNKCICKGNIVRVVFDNYEFMGCDNFREKGWDHFRIYKPTKPISADLFNYVYEPSSNYLVEMRKFYNLPKELKPSIILEYLLMKDITPLAETMLKIASNNKTMSNNRENLVRPILLKKLDKVKSQPLMIITLSDGTKIKKIPDFVCVKNSKVYIIEQKKDVHLINESQMELYCQAVSFLVNKSNKTLELDYRYIIENGITDEKNRIINFKDLENYEFN
jgi:hypothetical protein